MDGSTRRMTAQERAEQLGIEGAECECLITKEGPTYCVIHRTCAAPGRELGTPQQATIG